MRIESLNNRIIESLRNNSAGSFSFRSVLRGDWILQGQVPSPSRSRMPDPRQVSAPAPTCTLSKAKSITTKDTKEHEGNLSESWHE